MELINLAALVGIYISLFAGTFFLYTFFENRKIQKEPEEWPSVTIAVPAYNDAETISKTIESLLALDYPKEKLQLIVVENNCSTDGTYEVAKRYADKGVEVYSIPEGGKGHALNFALSLAKGEYFGGLDSDAFVLPDTLKNLIREFASKNIAAVTPSLKVYNPKKFLGKIQQVEYLMGVFLRKVFANLDSVHVTPGPLTLYRKSFFDKYGGYDEQNITEDLEIALRIQSHNMQIKNSIDGNVYVVNPETWWALARQRTRWYLGFLENVIRYKRLFNPKYGILAVYVLPMAFVSVSLAILFATYSMFKVGEQIITYPFFLRAIGYNFSTMASNWIAKLTHFTPGAVTFLAIPLTICSLSVLYIAKRYSKEKIHGMHLGILFIPYVLVYLYLFAIWWIMAISYKLFGRKVVFGGVAWDNSVITNVARRRVQHA